MEVPGVHYLKLAYLAETAIVFNLAYVELKWKQDFKKLADNTNQIAILSSPRNLATLAICKKRKCNNCDNTQHINDHFSRFTIEYLSKIQNTVRSDPSELMDATPINDVWSHATTCWAVTRKLLKGFHIIANKGYDKQLASFFLVVATAILVIITTIDNNMDILGFFSWLGLWSHESKWSSLFSYVLLATLLTPGILWCIWRKFLIEYECLGALLVNAYQEMSNLKVSDSVRNFRSTDQQL